MQIAFYLRKAAALLDDIYTILTPLLPPPAYPPLPGFGNPPRPLQPTQAAFPLSSSIEEESATLPKARIVGVPHIPPPSSSPSDSEPSDPPAPPPTKRARLRVTSTPTLHSSPGGDAEHQEKLNYVLSQADRPPIFLEIFSPTCPACQAIAARWSWVRGHPLHEEDRGGTALV